MDTLPLKRAATLGGIGLAAGLVGSAFMFLSQTTEMRLTRRKASDTPAKAVETLTGIEAPAKPAEQALSTATHFAFGTGLGLGLAALAEVPEPARGTLFFAGAWGTGIAVLTGLGLSDPPTRWDGKKLAIDLAHHAVYAATAAAAFAGLQKLVRLA